MVAIVNKFAGTCKTCQARVPAGKGIAKREGGKWAVLCGGCKGETHGATNPWRDLHRSYADSAAELAKTDWEFANSDELAEPCPRTGCGGTCHYRATVGVPQCPDCRAMIVYTIDQKTLVTTRKVIL